ncbi:unnamed protein product [Euphydryas editha]|uniref:HTH psq-type domain-containing protein n=1 Tax=Euphydryas editha TaxID=104508 RepID=A0AAU9TIP6_EUPED|nr:unnamed protein product [Euphydryas editha]
MPRNYYYYYYYYVSKTLRATWSETDLSEAMQKVRLKQMGVNEAARTYNIPSRTLRRHLLSGKLKVPLGRQPIFTEEEEKKLVIHIKKLEKVGFAPERKDVKEMGYQLALKLDKKAAFSQT